MFAFLAAAAVGGLIQMSPTYNPAIALDCTAGWHGIVARVHQEDGSKLIKTHYSAPYDGVTVPTEHALYTFTRPGDPAHPAIVRQVVREGMGGMTVDMSGCGFGDAQAFGVMMRDFTTRNRTLRHDIELRKPIPIRFR